MTRKFFFTTILIAMIPYILCAQTKFSLSGHITDSSNGEDLSFTNIGVREAPTIGTTTNDYGYYSLTLPKGTYTVVYSFMGYHSIEQTICLDKNVKHNVKLIPSTETLQEVVVSALASDNNVSSVQMSVEKLDMKQAAKMPVLMGEKDILKTIQLMPGISTVSEGGSGFSVRGGSMDQNLILLDEAPVYSASHLMGFFSVFNSDAIKGVSVYKGGIPAEYGGRASSVLDIQMKDGNNQNFEASGGIGLISSRLTLEGPIVKDRMSFIVSGRRSYADLVGKAINQLDDEMTLFFYDLNAKINYRINDNNRLFLSGYFGEDDFGFGDFGTKWGNTTGTVRWNHFFNEKLFSNTSFIYSNFSYGFNMSDEMSMNSGIEDFSLKSDLSYFANPSNTIKYGFDITHHTFNPGEVEFIEGETPAEIMMDKTRGLESAIYLANSQKLGHLFSMDYGLRLSMFNQLGEGYSNVYDNENNKTDSTYYGTGEIMQTYWNAEPRLSLNYRFRENSSIKASYNRMAQYLNLLSNSTSGQPTDVWMPSTSNIEPQIVTQYALGYFQNMDNNQYEFSVEAYYKTLDNVSDYEDGTDVNFNNDIEAYILSGEGRSYGAEFYIKKTQGKFNGWISYTLGRTENQIEGINDGSWYPTRYDKTHDVSVVANYEFNKRLSLSAAWVYYTGNAVTFPSGRYEYDGRTIPYYTERNGYRMPAYHRLDLNLHLEGKEKHKLKSSWDFSLYNAYNQKNAYTISFRESETTPGTTEAVKLSLYGIIPSVTWNFKF